MTKRTYFADLSGPNWPVPRDLERYFKGRNGASWPTRGGNDEWGLSAEGLYGTDMLADKFDKVNVHLYLTGYSELGVSLHYSRWDGRTKQKFDRESEGDMRRATDIVYSLQGTPLYFRCA
jgi:hypothetical protein